MSKVKMSRYLSIESVLFSANRLGLLHEEQRKKDAYHPVVNQAISILHWLSSECFINTERRLDNENNPILKAIELSEKLDCSIYTAKNILEVLIKLQIIEQITKDDNEYYRLIPF